MGYGKIKVLLVEDGAKASLEFQEAISSWNEFCLVGATGKQSEAVEIMANQEVDAVILDLELLEGDGLGVLEDMARRIPENRPFIIVTTNTQSDTILQQVRFLGADFIYQKTNLNYSPNQILDFIKKSLKFHAPVRAQNANLKNRDYARVKEGEMFRRHVAKALASMGFVASYKGTSLLRDAIIIAAETDNMVQITKHIYPMLSERYGMTVNSVEKNIRTAIEQTWLNENNDKLEQKYPYAINNDSGRPTNMNFICNVAEMMRNFL